MATPDGQREAIVDATSALLQGRGATGLNVKAIMAEAGVSRTAFYRRFATAHDAALAVLDRLLDHMVYGEPLEVTLLTAGHQEVVGELVAEPVRVQVVDAGASPSARPDPRLAGAARRTWTGLRGAHSPVQVVRGVLGVRPAQRRCTGI